VYPIAIAVLALVAATLPAGAGAEPPEEPPVARAGAAPPYPPPGDPPVAQAPPARTPQTRTVCRRGCDFRRIQAAVDQARAGDTVKVRRGTYREAVTISGARRDGLRLIGDQRHPARVTLSGRRHGSPVLANGVAVEGADRVTISGLRARGYVANGFLVIDAVGYRMTHLRAVRTGDYGIYALNSKGGVMADSEAHYTGDSAFYIGQTPPQRTPRRTIVRNVEGWGAPVGFAANNMRYVTIAGSRFYDNATGIFVVASTSERYPPPEDNAITGNDVFWNNFDISKGAPFEPVEGGVTLLAPAGTGILLLGGRRNVVAANRVFGNFLGGVALLEGVFARGDATVRPLEGNVVRGNAFGLDGADRNGRDLLYDGSGTGNCFAANSGVAVTVPADGATLAACPFGGANAFLPAVQSQLLSWAGSSAVPNWIRHPHAAIPGFQPLEVYEP
jgi:hypothetical protein